VVDLLKIEMKAKKFNSKRTHKTINLWTLIAKKTLSTNTLFLTVCILQFIYLMADLSIRL